MHLKKKILAAGLLILILATVVFFAERLQQSLLVRHTPILPHFNPGTTGIIALSTADSSLRIARTANNRWMMTIVSGDSIKTIPADSSSIIIALERLAVLAKDSLAGIGTDASTTHRCTMAQGLRVHITDTLGAVQADLILGNTIGFNGHSACKKSENDTVWISAGAIREKLSVDPAFWEIRTVFETAQ